MKLRPYQQEAVDKVLEAVNDLMFAQDLEGEKRDTIVLDAQVSWGKSIAILEIAKKLSEFETVLIVFPIRALIEQFVDTAKLINLEVGVIASGYDNQCENCNIQIGMFQSVVSRLEKGTLNFVPTIIIQDEIHKFSSGGTINKLKKQFGYSIRIGMTGTPYNAFGYQLDNVYKTIQTMTNAEMAKSVWHPNIETYVASFAEKLDFDNIKVTSSGDFDKYQLNNIIEKDTYINNVVNTMKHMNMQDRKVLLFTSSIHTAEVLNEVLQANGFSSMVYHSKVPNKQRDAILKSFINQEKYIDPNSAQQALPEFENNVFTVKCLVNVNALSTGFSDTEIEDLVIATSIGSRPKELQILGRNLRRTDKVETKRFLDCGSNFARFGFYYDDFNPVPKTEDREQNIINLAKEVDRLALLNLDELIDKDVVVQEISRDWYNERIARLEELEKELYKKKEEVEQVHVGTVKRKTDDTIVRIKNPQERIADIIKVYKTTVNIEVLVEAFIDIHVYINGLPKNKDGYEYKPSSNFFFKKMMPIWDKYHGQHRRWFKALKTRGTNIIKEGKNMFGWAFFLEFLEERYLDELEEQKRYMGVIDNSDNDDIEDEDIPF